MDTDGAVSSSSDADEREYEDYFKELNDGCGCTEIWEYLSEKRHSAD